MRKLFHKNHGFTLIEALVVIVILGILASLSFFGYSAYLRNARNAYGATVVQSYIDALNLYRAEKNTYPSFPEGYACLGEGYDILSDGSKTCIVQPPAQGVSPVQESTTLNTALKPYFRGGKLPRASDGKIYINPGWQFNITGVLLSDVPSNGWKLDGVRYPWFIIYFQEGSTTKCPVGPVATLVNQATQDFSSTPPASGYSAPQGDTAVACFVPLKAPSVTP